MPQTSAFGATCVALSIAIAGGLCLAETPSGRDPPDPYVGTYVGTFHPSPPNCAACHARATVRRETSGYVLTVDVDYTPMTNLCKGVTNRVVVLKGARDEAGLVLTNRNYSARVAGDTLVGRRLASGAAVTHALILKRMPEPEKPQR
jgi:hypothetical protein